METIKLLDGQPWPIDTAFQGESLEFMRIIPDNTFDLLFTDPPYGINQGGGNNKSRSKLAEAADYKDYGDKHPLTKEHFEEFFRISKNQIIFGANHFISLMPFDSPSWIVWDKMNGKTDFADCELAWTSFGGAVRKYEYVWRGMIQGTHGNKKLNEKRIHPNQKPLKLAKMILRDFSKKGDLIIDPCLGSFNFAIAAKQMGLFWAGCEKDEHYFQTGQDSYNLQNKQMMMEFE